MLALLLTQCLYCLDPLHNNSVDDSILLVSYSESIVHSYTGGLLV